MKLYYPKWDLNIQDPMLLEVWYDSLCHFDTEEFKEIIKTYCKNNSYPPYSPTDLLKVIPKEYTVDEAWEIVLNTLKKHSDIYYVYQDLNKYPSIYKCIKGINLNGEKDSFGNKCYNYSIGKEFKRRYGEYLKSLKVYYQNDKLISSNNKLLN